MLPTIHRFAPIIALLALVPGILFALDRSATVIGLSTISVVIIAASLAWMLSSSAPPGGLAE